MKRRGRSAALAPARLGILAASLLAPCAAAGQAASARVGLDVRWGDGAGSEALRDEFQRALAAGLATGCFTSVALEGGTQERPGADLALAVVLSDAIEETRFDDSIAGALQPRGPDDELRRLSHSSMTIEATLTAPRTGAVVYRKRFAASASRRPEFAGEDAQAAARADAIRGGVRTLERSLGCGRAKLARAIRRALAPHDPTGAPAR